MDLRKKKRIIWCIAAAVFVICAVAGSIITVRLYRQRKAIEREIASRDYSAMLNKVGQYIQKMQDEIGKDQAE